ncbi:MAG: ATP synthase F1 subunit delta [Syntrophorhabdaceae bacterium]|nr:ATP synthase F1 subunit delta [Syntrophorhabdaceae bacterium]MDD4196829.1 ATP synthase F1 subunit delta [Syntrophorhabdaceae bacterium]HOD75941.1 ATP synthase F1 subunit delta [Syntrophorhabdaceae bacterium]
MISQSIAKRYAKGLFNVGEKNGKYKEYQAEIEGVLSVLDKEERLKRAIVLPLVEVEKRKEVLSDVMKSLKISSPLASMFTMLLEKNRMGYLNLIRDVYNDLVDEKEGRVKGTLWTAFPVSDEIKVKIEKELGTRLSKKVTLAVQEDKNLIGGVKVAIKGTIIDGSVKRQLHTLQENILKE